MLHTHNNHCLFHHHTTAASQNRLSVIVPQHRLNYATGDIANALDKSTAEQGVCKTPITLNDAYFAITASSGRSIDAGFIEMIGYRLIAINEYPGDIITFAQAYRRRQFYMEPLVYTGIIVQCFKSEYILAERVLISSYDGLFTETFK
jgi:hypothetical protein